MQRLYIVPTSWQGGPQFAGNGADVLCERCLAHAGGASADVAASAAANVEMCAALCEFELSFPALLSELNRHGVFLLLEK